MAKNCNDCKYYDTDYLWDGEDEWEEGACEKHHDDFLNDDEEECPHFKKYKQKPYKEPKPTRCDTCEFRNGCENVLEITEYWHDSRHGLLQKGRRLAMEEINKFIKEEYPQCECGILDRKENKLYLLPFHTFKNIELRAGYEFVNFEAVEE